MFERFIEKLIKNKELENEINRRITGKITIFVHEGGIRDAIRIEKEIK